MSKALYKVAGKKQEVHEPSKSDNDNLGVNLASRRRGDGTHHPISIYLQNAHRDLGSKHGNSPVAERVCSEMASLPLFPQMIPDKQEEVVSAVFNFLETRLSLFRRR